MKESCHQNALRGRRSFRTRALVGVLGLLVCWGLVGCAQQSASVRRQQIRQYPKIPRKVARGMMRQSLASFCRGVSARRVRDGSRTELWGQLVRDMKPLLVSLGSYSLLKFRRTVTTYRRKARAGFWGLPVQLRQQVADLEWVAGRRIRRARRAALKMRRLARREVRELETALEENTGVSKKELKRLSKPRRRVRRASRRRYASLELLFPVPGRRIGSGYGWRRGPISGRWGFHTGVDIGARRGTRILAAEGGVVLRARRMGGCGYGVILRHDGLGHRRVTTTYCHMSRILVRRRQRVRRGQTIGLIGSTGNSTGPHLHFAIHINRKHVNPKHHLPGYH